MADNTLGAGVREFIIHGYRWTFNAMRRIGDGTRKLHDYVDDHVFRPIHPTLRDVIHGILLATDVNHDERTSVSQQAQDNAEV